MKRIYANEQLEAIEKIIQNLIIDLESTYLTTFDKLKDQDLGDGQIASLTQLILLSRDAAISTLQSKSNEN